MAREMWRLREGDLRFLLETVAAYVDPERVDAADLTEMWLEAVLEDDEVFERLVNSKEFLLAVSPWLYFNVLLRRARHELTREAFTLERRARQKVVVFDTEAVAALLEDAAMRDYLAALLASFTRVSSRTVRVALGRGIWRRYRTSDLDVEGLMRYAGAVEEAFRFEPYKRIGDVCLFLTGMFPEYTEGRRAARGRLLEGREDYERYGRAFYQLAAEHERAEVGGLGTVLARLSEEFVVAEKPLAFLAERYLWGWRHELFGI